MQIATWARNRKNLLGNMRSCGAPNGQGGSDGFHVFFYIG